MPDLLALQTAFAAALRDRGRTDAVGRWLAGDGELVDRRMAVYRANMVAAADKALSSAYPVIRQVLGGEFFHGLAREFQCGSPSTSGDLTRFGAAFDTFLDTFEHTRSLPYLPDLARLEWAVHTAYGAADAPDWDAAELGAVEPGRQAAIRLHWTPGLAVVESGFPIVRIWSLHQPCQDGDFSVDWTAAENALVARQGFAITVSACSAGEAAFLAASLAGDTLGDAVTAALHRQSDFDLGQLLGRAFSARLICGLNS
jgi:hypothetical protein